MSDNQQFCLRWNNHQSTLVQVIDSLLSSGVLVDCTLAAEGQFLHAHKVVLCACSPYLETLLSQHYEKHPIVILKDVKFQELKSMMDYMYKGEVNISQDQLGQFLKAAESLQIKGLTDGGGENDSRDVGSTSQKRHEPTPVRKPVPHQSRSPLVLPSHSTGLTIEPSKRSLPSHLSESQPDSPIRSREGSSSPTSRKRRRQRRPSQGDEDGHQDNSCDLPMQAQTMSITTVPSSIPTIPSGSSSTITKAPPPDEDSENPESDRLSGLPTDGYIKEKIEPQPEMLIEPKTEYMEETNNDDSVEDLTLDDDDDYENMMEGGPGPSHSANNPNENYATWQQMTGDRQDEAYLNPADTGHRDSQGAGHRQSLRQSFTPEKLAGLNQILSKRRVFSPEDIRNIASYFKLQESKCRIWFKENGARLRRQACSVRISPDVKKNSSDKRKNFVLKVRKRRPAVADSAPKKKKSVVARTPSSANARSGSSRPQKNLLNARTSSAPVKEPSTSEVDTKTKIREAVDVKPVLETLRASAIGDGSGSAVSCFLVDIKQEMVDADESAASATNATAASSSSSPENQRGHDKFFHDLPYSKQIMLLKRTENLTYASSADSHQLAAEFDLPAKSVYGWLKSKCVRNLQLWNKKLTRKKMTKLNEELNSAAAAAAAAGGNACSDVPLTDERALMLSYELDLSIQAIRKWFERRRSELLRSEEGGSSKSESVGPPAAAVAAAAADCRVTNNGESGDSAIVSASSSPVVLVRQCQGRAAAASATSTPAPAVAIPAPVTSAAVPPTPETPTTTSVTPASEAVTPAPAIPVTDVSSTPMTPAPEPVTPASAAPASESSLLLPAEEELEPDNASVACEDASSASSSPSSGCPVENELNATGLASGENDKLVKRRYVLTPRQKRTLLRQFQTSQCVSPSEAASLSATLNLPVKAIQLWFHRKRLEAKKLLVPRQTADEAENDVENQMSSVDEVVI